MMRLRYDRSLLMRLSSGLFACAVVQWSGRSLAGPQLPVPCVATSCGTGVKGFVTSGAASAVQSGSTLSVSQTTNTATLNWSSFNIGAGGKVVFTQPASTSIALNRIYGSNPSSIFGSLSANGQIYLINANGFLFGNGATVNVGGLLASSLNLSDSTFASGLLVPGQTGVPALQPFVDA
jgi:filamentous hemagglutinin family protein